MDAGDPGHAVASTDGGARWSVDPGLPIAAHADDIAALIRDHPVVVIAGQTGSGKTTQIPKICLALGRERIAHTQPRRIAARAVATRVAAELGVPVGDLVGYQVRFTREVTKDTALTVMTDGVLLTQIARDRQLRRYDTIILDEAHERSLTIDFLLGYLKQLLPRRPELRVVITSATIDTARFARHFDDAPVIEVSGRGYPVEVRYRPPSGDQDQTEAIVAAVRELREVGHGHGDILVFLAGEREIRDAADALGAARLSDCEVLPLYARLSAAEQQRVFAPHPGQRIVLATNVAETSLTVPGVRYVVDPGLARISRYSARTKVQRLPIEPVSRASADQRAGRCGRVAPGICVRLYSEEDYLARPEYTPPEILRTNLASVILQMGGAHLGDIGGFPFLDPPEAAHIADGMRLLVELGAIAPTKRGEGHVQLTPIGRQLARLPVDPRLGRILLESAHRGCLREAIVLVAGYSIQDVRERPTDRRAQADAAHARYTSDGNDPGGDIAAMLRLWSSLRERRREMSGTQFRRACRDEFLNFPRVREWQDLVTQLRDVCAELKLRPQSAPAPLDAVVMSVLSGFLSQIGLLTPPTPTPAAARRERTSREYVGTRGARFVLSPASVLARHPPRLVMAVELVETTRVWAHAAAAIDPEWVEQVGEHLLTRSYSSPHFSSDSGTVVAYERTSLLGVPLVSDRLTSYALVAPGEARAIFIREALAERGWTPASTSPLAEVMEHNWWLWEQVEHLEDRARRRDLLISTDELAAFFETRIPSGIVSVAALEDWVRRDPTAGRLLMVREEDLVAIGAGTGDLGQFPDTWTVGALTLPVDYTFEPGHERDGVSVRVSVAQLGALPSAPFTWQVPGLRLDAATELIRTLPKAIRTRFVPARDWAARALAWLDEHGADAARPFDGELGRALGALSGDAVDPQAWRPKTLPAALRVGFAVVDADQEAGFGKDLAALQARFAPRVEARLTRAVSRQHHALRTGTSWVFGDLPDHLDLGSGVCGYPALRDDRDHVSEMVAETPERQRAEHHRGVVRLLALTLPDPSPYAVAYLSNDDRLALATSPYATTAALWADARHKAIDQLAARDGDPAAVRTQAAFDALAVAVRRGLAAQVRLVVTSAAATLREAARVRLALDRIAPDDPVARDVRAQLDDLVYPGFISFTRDPWFSYLPRYLQAAAVRLGAAAENPGRDARHREEVAELWADYARLVDEQPPGRLDAAVEDIGFLFEEWRIQLFAQALGTHVTVSPKRLRQAITAARNTPATR